MTFGDRTRQADAFVQLMLQHFWSHPSLLRDGVFTAPYGYETHIPSGVQQRLKCLLTPVTQHVRFTPDYIVGRLPGVLSHSSESAKVPPVVLWDYKVTATPRYSFGAKQWTIGQIEAAAWDQYRRLVRAQVPVVLNIYCPYHTRPLLAGIPEDRWLISGPRRPAVSRGSGTPYVNIDLAQLDSLDDFLADLWSLSRTLTTPRLLDVLEVAVRQPSLAVTHHPQSPDRYRLTGFNWDARFHSFSLSQGS